MSDMTVGGQAVIEGVMMRTPHAFTVAVRAPDGSIVLKEDAWRSIWDRLTFLRWPFLRGTVVMIEALVNGLQALTFAANVAEPDPASGSEAALDSGSASASAAGASTAHPSVDSSAQAPAGEPLSNAQLTMTIATSFVLGIGMFVALPHLLTAGIGWLIGGNALDPDGFAFHLVDGFIKLCIFIAYIWAISRIPEIRRVFQYHGAEHKSVYAYEAQVPLTVDSVRQFSTLHPRCGTSFLMFVMLVSIFLFTAVFPLFAPSLAGMPKLLSNLVMVAVKIPLMLPIAGISYEAIRFSGRFPDNPVLGLLSKPGLWMQRLTTGEPDDQQLEVALAALKSALRREADWQEHNGQVDASAAALRMAAAS